MARILSVITLVVLLLALSAPVSAQNGIAGLPPVPEPEPVPSAAMQYRVHLPFLSR